MYKKSNISSVCNIASFELKRWIKDERQNFSIQHIKEHYNEDKKAFLCYDNINILLEYENMLSYIILYSHLEKYAFKDCYDNIDNEIDNECIDFFGMNEKTAYEQINKLDNIIDNIYDRYYDSLTHYETY